MKINWQVSTQLDEAETKKAETKISEIIAWLSANRMAEKEEYEDRQKELEAVCGPMIEKLGNVAVGKSKPDGCASLSKGKEVAAPQPEEDTCPTIEDLCDELAVL